MEEFSVLKQVFGDAEKPAEAPAADPPVKENKWGVSPFRRSLDDHLFMSRIAEAFGLPTSVLREAPPVSADPVAESNFIRRSIGTHFELRAEDGRCELFIVSGGTSLRLGGAEVLSWESSVEERPSSIYGYATVQNIRLDGMRWNALAVRQLCEMVHHGLVATE